MIQKFAKMSKTAWIEKLENDLSVMRLAPKQFKQEISEKEAILSVLNAVEMDESKDPLGSSEGEYLTVAQYNYAIKTGDWESGKTFNYRQDQSYISDQVQEKIDDEIFKEELEEHFTNLENIELIATESFKPLYENLVETMKKYFTIDDN
ncbi:hypothetical protein DF186_12030 [Enterococcus hirae]|uniref:hypothetical protein n=1 Tax=Enterococcus hirae TaxID=1354 RepID=UPI000BA0EF71|nr:hypothetical protein [Enterococcus hirae]OZS39941.1 hypothetical protein CHB54_08810 [Enterococcus hirae]OZS41081.1 hypothetical protein CHB54_00525 [Enterococcus hirae]PWG75548.1 hypothetical protein DF186_12030 [Enterococcus hirae]